MSPPGASILVVDDEVDTCRNLSDILTDLGYHVDISHDGLGALELVRRNTYDVALLDLKMPGMDGLTLYREIKKLRAGTVALIVSAYASDGVAEEALEAGAWRVVPKPVDFPRLQGLVDEALDQPLVLVVDDDPDLCASLWDLLRQEGYRVAVAHDERTAEDQLRGKPHHVVLIDMKLPIGDGGGVFRLVRQANPQARTVVITGHRAEMDELVRKVMAEGADAVCYKPFDIPRLLGVLEQLTIQDSGVRRQEAEGLGSASSGGQTRSHPDKPGGEQISDS
jgi:CheY-like chemotaxis protein